MAPPLRITILGLGEAGDAIAHDLVAAGAQVSGYDPNVSPLPAGVREWGNEAEAVGGADVVLSVNSSHDALPALINARPRLSAGTIWADLNTAAPAVKVSLVDQLVGRGVEVVDVALMAPVPGKGLRTPMLVSGPAAHRFAELLGRLGAEIGIQPGPVGEAISRKLLRSVFYKGLAAAVVEALTAAEVAGCADWLSTNLRTELTGFDASSLDRLVDGTYRHARRRADEMAAAAALLTELGVEARIAAAARDLLADLRDRQEAAA